jgi:asparagine synthase (glutamine-hydrolysing)
MCGISGIFDSAGVDAGERCLVETFNSILRHRGPDDAGIYVGSRCILGHRRLAIIDLSSDGRQPFASEDGRYQLVFNGEIYNFIELRQELIGQGFRFRTKTDTEVLLAAYQHYGPSCLNRFNGMFALAVYDTRDGTLFLARDRLGVKPLYYVLCGSRLYFASEIKALFAIPGFSPSLNEQSLFDYLVFNRTDVHDETFTREVKRLPKGHWASFGPDGLRLVRWWDPRDFLGSGRDTPAHIMHRELEELMVSAVSLRMRSDVPVGSCLSGGLDSSILVGILFDRLGMKPDYPTFTAVYPGHAIDESRFVDAVAKAYPVRSHRTSPSAQGALSDLEAMVWHTDEPTTGFTFYSQFAVMRLAKQHGVVVLLDGQGGDESFAGYQYFHGFHMYGLLRQGRIAALAKELFQVLRRRQEISALQTLAYQALPDVLRRQLLFRSVPLVSRDFFEAHIGQSRIHTEFFAAKNLNDSIALHFRYKLEHLLRTEDRNSMAFALEARVPYLDYRLVEYLLGVDEALKIRGGETKRLQKQALGKYTIPEILNRRDKIGFGTPSAEWAREPGWQELTAESLRDIKSAFPGIIAAKATLPAAADQCWKINNLAIWRRLFLARQAAALAPPLELV